MDDVTCIVPNYPDVNIVVNTSLEPKEVKIRDSINNKNFILAPGEGRIPSNIMREKNSDVKGFPLKHKSGKYGLDDEDRKINLTRREYFIARLFYYRRVFSND